MKYYYVGQIVKTHGIKGELRIRSQFDKKDKVFLKGKVLYFGEEYIPFKILTYRKHKEFDMFTFEGYDNINQVLPFLKMPVYAKKEELSLKEGEYLLEELVGLEILYEGAKLGKVEEIVYNGTNVLLSVSGEKHFYIPYHENFIKKVDFERNAIITENTKGLIL